MLYFEISSRKIRPLLLLLVLRVALLKPSDGKDFRRSYRKDQKHATEKCLVR
jgi:hypothetical protein